MEDLPAALAAEVPDEVRPEPLVARILPRFAVEHRIATFAAEGDERVLDGRLDVPLQERLAPADALDLARARAYARARG